MTATRLTGPNAQYQTTTSEPTSSTVDTKRAPYVRQPASRAQTTAPCSSPSTLSVAATRQCRARARRRARGTRNAAGKLVLMLRVECASLPPLRKLLLCGRRGLRPETPELRQHHRCAHSTYTGRFIFVISGPPFTVATHRPPLIPYTID